MDCPCRRLRSDNQIRGVSIYLEPDTGASSVSRPQLGGEAGHIQHAGGGVSQREGTIPASPLPGNTPRLGGKDDKTRVRDGRQATWGEVSG